MTETQFRSLYRKPSLCGLEAFAVDLTRTEFRTATDLWSWPEWRARVAIIRDRLGLAPIPETMAEYERVRARAFGRLAQEVHP